MLITIWNVILLLSFIASIVIAFVNRELAILTIPLIIVTYYYVDSVRKTRWHETFLTFKKEYQTKDMRNSISRLYEFYRQCDSDEDILRSSYRLKLNNDTLQDIDLDRRKLLLYYYHLGILYKYGILHWRIMYDMFAISDLKIIPKILIPLL